MPAELHGLEPGLKLTTAYQTKRLIESIVGIVRLKSNGRIMAGDSSDIIAGLRIKASLLRFVSSSAMALARLLQVMMTRGESSVDRRAALWAWPAAPRRQAGKIYPAGRGMRFQHHRPAQRYASLIQEFQFQRNRPDREMQTWVFRHLSGGLAV